MKIKAGHYRQHDADFTLDVPAEGFGGWRKSEIEIDPKRTALVVMHAWDVGTREQFPGWHRVVEFFSRSEGICRDVFPPLLSAVRASPVRVFHVVGGGPCEFKNRYPGYRRVLALAGDEPPPPEQIEVDESLERLRRFRDEQCTGVHNSADIQRGFARIDFPPQAMPVGDEPIAQTTRQLLAVCRDTGVNHLIYAGFAINWCLLLSPGGMVEMSRHGVMCSAIRQAVTAVENKETARDELCKQIALWRVAMSFGYVFDLDDFLAAVRR